MPATRRTGQRGSTLIESTLALLSFAVVLGGIMEVGFAGMISNSLEFATQQAARYASTRGSGSGHAATVSDVQTVVRQSASPLTTGSLTVTVTWTPDNNPGSTVQVQASYSIKPAFLPLSGGPMTLTSTARAMIAQ